MVPKQNQTKPAHWATVERKPNFSDIQINGGVARAPFYPDDDRYPLSSVLDQEIMVEDAAVFRDYETDLGKSDFALLRFSGAAGVDGGSFAGTTICGGVVVVQKVQKAIDDNLLPLTGTITRVPSKTAGHSPYYDIK